MADSHQIALVVNPVAGRGRVGRELPSLFERLDAAGEDYAVLRSKHPGHAVDLAESATAEAFQVIAAVGGDGTVNEVVNGMLGSGETLDAPRLGVMAAGSGSDFARTFDLPRHARDVEPPFFAETSPLDVGRITCDGTEGRVTRYFVNVAEVGLGAEVVARAARLPRRLGRSRYLVAFWPALARFSPCEMRIVVDGEALVREAHNVVVANARYFGGGMLISPHSDPADGSLDVQVNVGPKRQALTLIPRIYRGSHLPDPRIIQLAGSSIMVDADRPLPVEADGEIVGTTPATITVLPRALRLARSPMGD